jgi:hypothetical protein
MGDDRNGRNRGCTTSGSAGDSVNPISLSISVPYDPQHVSMKSAHVNPPQLQNCLGPSNYLALDVPGPG